MGRERERGGTSRHCCRKWSELISGDGDVACPLETKIRKPPKQLDVDQPNHLRATTCNQVSILCGERVFVLRYSNLSHSFVNGIVVRLMHNLMFLIGCRESIKPFIGVADVSCFFFDC